MEKKTVLVLIAVVLFTASCSKYYKFDELYNKGKVLEAYQVLMEIKKKEGAQYYIRLYQSVINLSLNGDLDFIQKLGGLTDISVPRQAKPYQQLGKAFFLFHQTNNLENYQLAISVLSNISTIPDEFKGNAYQIRGISHYKLGNWDLAISDLQQSYRITSFVDNYYFIGLCYIGLEKFDDALGSFDRVLRETENALLRGQAYFQRGEIYYVQESYQQALNEYMEAINNYCNSANYNFKIGKCLQRLGYETIPSKFYRVSLRIDKDFADAWYQLNVN